jgi:hypothetical protein
VQDKLPLSVASVVRRSEGLIDSEIDGEIVALNIESGTCYGLNKVGSRIWRLLGAPIRVSDLCAALLADYEVDPVVCERHVIDLLEELRAEGMIHPSSEAAANANDLSDRL